MERGKRRVNWDFHNRQCEKHFRGYLNQESIQKKKQTNISGKGWQPESLHWWLFAELRVYTVGEQVPGVVRWLFRPSVGSCSGDRNFIWQYQELGMADSKPVWATWRQAGKEEPPRLFVCLCWNWLHEYMMLLLRLKNYFLSISGLKEAAPSNTGWFFNWASPENVSRLAPLCFEKVLSMAAEKGEIPYT